MAVTPLGISFIEILLHLTNAFSSIDLSSLGNSDSFKELQR